MFDQPNSDIRLRHMSDDERRGFDYALEMLKTWATQIEAAMVNVPATGISVPLEEQQANSARMTRSLAEALRRGTPRHN